MLTEAHKNFGESTKDTVRELHAAAREQAQTLKSQSEAASRNEKSWSDLYDYISRDWPLHVIHHMDKQAPMLRQMRVEGHRAVPELEDAYRTAKERATELIRRFPSHFERACRDAGLKLDLDCRHPRYSLEAKFLHLEIDDNRAAARISNTEGKLADLPADVEAIVQTLDRERKRLFDRPFDGRKFLKLLRSQYLALLKHEKHQDGASIPIRHITRRLGKNLKRFRTDEFLVDLTRLIDSGPLEVDGYRLDLQQTKDIDQGILLPGPAGRGYVGFVVFKKA